MPKRRTSKVAKAGYIKIPPGHPIHATRDLVDEKKYIDLDTFPLTGQCPPFNDWTNVAIDDSEQKVYIFGGCTPGGIPTSNFHSLDIKSKAWQNLTVSGIRSYHLGILF
jgi:Galactose oxidase, central domain